MIIARMEITLEAGLANPSRVEDTFDRGHLAIIPA